METTLKKNRSGYWEIRWSERQPDGRWRSKSATTGTKSKPKAEAFRRAWLAAEVRDQQEATGVTIGDLLDKYTRHHVEPNGTASQLWSIKPIRAYFEAISPEDLTPDDVLEYRAMRAAAGRKDGTIRRELGALTAALNWAAKNRLLDKEKVPHVPLPAEGQGRERFLLEEQEADVWDKALAASAQAKRLSRVTRFVCIALATAARKEAILTLRWDQVDFATGLIDFKDVSRAASKKRRSKIPIASRLLPVLDRARREATTDYVLDHPGAIRTAYETFMSSAGYPDITPHDLRRTWATLRARRGVPLWDIAAVLGDTIETVTKHYAVHQPEHLKGAIE